MIGGKGSPAHSICWSGNFCQNFGHKIQFVSSSPVPPPSLDGVSIHTPNCSRMSPIEYTTTPQCTPERHAQFIAHTLTGISWGSLLRKISTTLINGWNQISNYMESLPTMIVAAMKIDMDDLQVGSNDDGCFLQNPQSPEIPQSTARFRGAISQAKNGRRRKIRMLQKYQ